MIHSSKLRNQHWYIIIRQTPDFIWISPVISLMSFSVWGSNLGYRPPHIVLDSPVACDSSSVFPWQAFMTLTDFRSTGQMFCRMSLNLRLSDVFLMIRLGLWVWGKNTTVVSGLSSRIRGTWYPCDLSLVRVTSITWVRWCLLGFSTEKYKLSLLILYSLEASH